MLTDVDAERLRPPITHRHTNGATECMHIISFLHACLQVDAQGYCPEAGERLKVVDLQDEEW